MYASFEEIKSTVLSLISSQPHVDNAYAGPKTGIYLLYVDNFSDSSIIPIYVGKTVNFKQRLKQHIRDIDEINKSSFVDYQTGFLRGAYGMRCSHEGKYKACKIFKYMLDHNCQWPDLRMIVLEVCEKEQLSEKEQSWIDRLRPAYVGFNQIDSITLQWLFRDQPQQYRNLILTEAELFRQYLDYGYSAFNYLHAFSDSRYNPYKGELDQRAAKHISGSLPPESPKARMNTFFALYDDYRREFEQARPIIEQRYAPYIHECFEKCKLKSKARENEVIDLMINSDPHNVIQEAFATKEYLRYYMGRNRASKQCGELLSEYIEMCSAEIAPIVRRVTEAYNRWVEYRTASLASSQYGLIFPNAPFSMMPLGEML